MQPLVNKGRTPLKRTSRMINSTFPLLPNKINVTYLIMIFLCSALMELSHDEYVGR
jgi:hypothetical protein